MTVTRRPLSLLAFLVAAATGLGGVGASHAAAPPAHSAPVTVAPCATVEADHAAASPAIEVSGATLAFGAPIRTFARGAHPLLAEGALRVRHASAARRALARTGAPHGDARRPAWRSPGQLRAGGADDDPSA